MRGRRNGCSSFLFPEQGCGCFEGCGLFLLGLVLVFFVLNACCGGIDAKVHDALVKCVEKVKLEARFSFPTIVITDIRVEHLNMNIKVEKSPKLTQEDMEAFLRRAISICKDNIHYYDSVLFGVRCIPSDQDWDCDSDDLLGNSYYMSGKPPLEAIVEIDVSPCLQKTSP